MNIMGAPIPPKVQSSISCDFKFPLPYKLPAGY
jgi:hypothetical protein